MLLFYSTEYLVPDILFHFFNGKNLKLLFPAIIFLSSIHAFGSDKSIMSTHIHWVNNSQMQLGKVHSQETDP